MAYGKNHIKHGLQATGTKKSSGRPRTKQVKSSGARKSRTNKGKSRG